MTQNHGDIPLSAKQCCWAEGKHFQPQWNQLMNQASYGGGEEGEMNSWSHFWGGDWIFVREMHSMPVLHCHKPRASVVSLMPGLRTRVLSWGMPHPALLFEHSFWTAVFLQWHCRVQQLESRANTWSWATAAKTPQCFIPSDTELDLSTHLPGKSFYIPLPWPVPAGPPSQSVPFKFTRKEITREKDTLLLHFFK